MDTREIPLDVAASIKHCWPNGVVEEFSADESYFHEIRLRLERDLQSIRGASMLWQSEEEEISASCDDDQNDEPLSNEWQSLDPVRLARSGGFGAAELRELERLVMEHAQLLLGKWNEYFIVTD